MRFFPAAFAVAAATTTAAAQHLIAYDPIPPGTGMMWEEQLPTALLPGPLPPIPVYPIVPALPPVPPGALAPPGDATFDGLAGLTWYTEGATLAAMPSPSFGVVGPAPVPFPIAPAVIAALGGPVTGMAIDPVAGIMYLTSAGGLVIGVVPVPGTPIIVPAFLPGFAMGPVTGLDWDGISGTLFACDLVGTIYNFFVGGLPAAPPLLIGAVPPPVGDVAIDKTGFLNAVGLRPIYVIGPGIALDATFAAAPPLPIPAAMATGLAFLPRPASNSPGVTCPCGGLVPTFGVTAPMVTGNPLFGIAVGGLPVGMPVLMAYDGVFVPGFPVINATGCGLGLFPASLTIVSFFGIAGPGGVAVWPLPLTLLPPGIGPVFAQAAFPCPLDPFGLTLTPVQQISVCGH